MIVILSNISEIPGFQSPYSYLIGNKNGNLNVRRLGLLDVTIKRLQFPHQTDLTNISLSSCVTNYNKSSKNCEDNTETSVWVV